MTSLPIAVLISGGGTTLKNLIELRDAGKLDVDFRIVISSRSDAKGLLFAEQAKIATLVAPKRKSHSAEQHSDSVFGPIRESGAELVVMGGYLQHVLIPEDFENRVINIHPSLIPAFCGQGMYGLKVHQAAIDLGLKFQVVRFISWTTNTTTAPYCFNRFAMFSRMIQQNPFSNECFD